MDFRVGTSGWHYKHWRGDFYPTDLATKDWFDWYAARFDTVELNNSFYRQPSNEAWSEWKASAPQGFVFAVKASRFITHIKRLNDPHDSLRRAVDGAERLGDHLGPLLYQLPPNFKRSDENLERLTEFVRLLPKSYRHAIEFRDEEWFVEPTFDLLAAHGVAFCSFDMPGLKCPVRTTADFGYMRFHGSGERYGGNYTDAMLRGWAAQLDAASGDAREWLIYFNNDIGGHAPRNAITLRDMLTNAS